MPHMMHSDLPFSRRTLLGGAMGGLALASMPGPSAAAENAAPTTFSSVADAEWRSFLGGLDLRWGRVPTSFYEAPFLGNGGLGGVVYQVSGGRLAINLGDSRVRDHQSAGGDLWGKSRLPVG